MRSRIVIALIAVTAVAPPLGGPLSSARDAGEATASVGAELLDPRERCNRACRRERLLELRESRPFARTSFWNARLADDAPLDEKSRDYVNRLRYLLGRWEPYVNTTRYSTPVYTVPADQKTVRVELDNVHRDLQAAFERVPLPRRARPAAGTDGHLVVWQPATDTMWEFWRMRRRADGWHAAYGGRMTNVSESPGHFRAITTSRGRFLEHHRWGATATSLPLLGGLMRIDELKAGRIDHGLAIALPEIRAGVYSWPAQRTDGRSDHRNAIPQGARFRIDPALDLSQIPMSPMVRMMAVAAQRYGIVVRDGAGAITFYAEDPTSTRRNPFLGPNGLFGGRYISEALRTFPWEHLQVLKTELREDPDSDSGLGILPFKRGTASGLP